MTNVGRFRIGDELCLAAALFALPLFATPPQRAASEHRADGKSAALLVIQGRVTEIQDTQVKVKTPDGMPGGPGIHAMYVTSGPTFEVDISHARVLLPDGKHADKAPLAVGEHVVMVLEKLRTKAQNNETPAYSASVIERVAAGDSIVTH